MTLLDAVSLASGRENEDSFLELSGIALPHLQLMEIPRDEIRRALIMSDGFYRLVDTYDAYTDRSLIDAARDIGLPALMQELRAIEQGDPGCRIHPRLKPRDDATALLLDVSTDDPALGSVRPGPPDTDR